MTAGGALLGLSSVVSACTLGTFSRKAWKNHLVGILCGLPLMLSFEAFKIRATEKTRNTLSELVSSRLWTLASVCEYNINNLTWIPKRRVIANNVLVYAFTATIFGLFYYYVGIAALGKYYLAPVLLFHIYQSITLRVASQNSTAQPTLTRIAAHIQKQYEHRDLSVPALSRFIAKSTPFVDWSRPYRILETLLGWEMLTPPQMAFESLHQTSICEHTLLREGDEIKAVVREDGKPAIDPEAALASKPLEEEEDDSWLHEVLPYDYGKIAKLMGIHTMGLVGLYAVSRV
jgi:hypothetical protein